MTRKILRVSRRGFWFLLTWSFRQCLFLCWHFPITAYGKWVMIGFYGVIGGWFFVKAEVIDLQSYIVWSLLWLYAARWRWNYFKSMRGAKPLFQRRRDI